MRVTERQETTVWADRLLARPGRTPVQRGVAIDIAGGRIAGLREGAAPPAAGSGGPGGPGILALPALANAHDHGRGLRPSAYGVADDAVEFWVPGTYTLPPLDPYLVAAVALGRMAASGTERLIAEADAVARAAREIGVRVAFVVPLRDRNRLGYGDDDAILAHMDEGCRAAVAAQFRRPLPAIDAQLAAVEEIAARCAGPLFHVQYGPIGAEWCSDALLARVAEAAARSGLRVHMHLLESPIQRRWADAAYPGGLVRHLDALGLLSPQLAVAHGVWLRPEDCALLAERGVTVSVNSTSNLRLRSGIAPMAAIRAARLGFALGMDSLSLDDDEDMLRELRLAFRLHRGFGLDDTLNPAGLFDAAMRCGACVVSGAEGFGAVTPGCPADLLLLDYDAMSADMIDGVCDETEVVLARAAAEHVRGLIVAGRAVVADGKLTGLDLAAAERELTAAARAFAPQLAALRPVLAGYRAGLRRFYAAGGEAPKSAAS
jgi:cytosine/adenosine deaminase-related metal-dependent hydrolase